MLFITNSCLLRLFQKLCLSPRGPIYAGGGHRWTRVIFLDCLQQLLDYKISCSGRIAIFR
jgi:hypothetical protein